MNMFVLKTLLPAQISTTDDLSSGVPAVHVGRRDPLRSWWRSRGFALWLPSMMK